MHTAGSHNRRSEHPQVHGPLHGPLHGPEFSQRHACRLIAPSPLPGTLRSFRQSGNRHLLPDRDLHFLWSSNHAKAELANAQLFQPRLWLCTVVLALLNVEADHKSKPGLQSGKMRTVLGVWSGAPLFSLVRLSMTMAALLQVCLCKMQECGDFL